MTQPLVSLIIRTKNEERWIAPCLRSVFAQTYKNIEVVIVDNGSTDNTLKRVAEFPTKIVHIDEFIPGKAINDGIRASSGEILVCLSGHCVPVSTYWLEHLVQDLKDPAVAGVYGRQEPLSYSSDLDKRDLITVFGLDKKVQIRDSFFHNANSAFRRDVWERFPFDETVTNIEDRVWGQQVIAAGMKIVYEPDASVYHWHGIHHELNPERARKIVRILESIDGLLPKNNLQAAEDLNIVAIIPLRGKSQPIQHKTLLEYTIRAAQQATLIKHIVVATDDADTAALANALGASAPFLRPKELSEDYVGVTDVLRYTLEKIESRIGVPDLVVALEETYPFREPALLDNMIRRLVAEGLDTVIPAKPEMRGIWLENEGETQLLAEGFMPSQLKQSRAMVGLMGLACVTHPMFIHLGDMRGGRLGIFEVNDPLATLQIRDPASLQLAETLLDRWWQQFSTQ